MATTVIYNNCLAGALSGIMSGRPGGNNVSATAADHAAAVNAAASVADEFIVANTASGAALADADNANIGVAVFGAAYALCAGRNLTSTTDADYLKIGQGVYGAAKQALASLQ